MYIQNYSGVQQASAEAGHVLLSLTGTSGSSPDPFPFPFPFSGALSVSLSFPFSAVLVSFPLPFSLDCSSFSSWSFFQCFLLKKPHWTRGTRESKSVCIGGTSQNTHSNSHTTEHALEDIMYNTVNRLQSRTTSVIGPPQ